MVEEKLSLRVIEIFFETPVVKTIVFQRTDNKEFLYQPGQFLSVIVDISAKELRRSYSLSSTPGVDAFPAFTFKRIPNGEVSRYLFDYLKNGDIFYSLVPAGRFVVAEEQSDVPKDIILIAAGSGITPIFSILKHCLKSNFTNHITLIYSNTSEATAIFYRQLLQLENAYPLNFKCLFIFSDPIETSLPKRHLNFELLSKLIRENLKFKKEDTEFYICGPFTYMRMAQTKIEVMGFDKNKIYKETFFSPPLELKKVNRVGTDYSTKTVSITYKGNQFQVNVPYDKTILKTALEQGINLPYSCNAGICGTCIALCTQGKVFLSVNEVLTEKDLKRNLILTCVAYPESREVRLLIN